MWRLKPFAHKEQTGLEGRVINVGNYKVQVRNAIAEGGFSCVYVLILSQACQIRETILAQCLLGLLPPHQKHFKTHHQSPAHNSGRLKPPKAEATHHPFKIMHMMLLWLNSTLMNKVPHGLQKPKKEEMLEAEIKKLKNQLANLSAEKADITAKCEKLSAICRSQRQEIQDLKHAVASRTSSHSGDSARALDSSGSQSSTIQLLHLYPTETAVMFYFLNLTRVFCLPNRMRILKEQFGNFSKVSLTMVLQAQILSSGGPLPRIPSHRPCQNLLEQEIVSRTSWQLNQLLWRILGGSELIVSRWFLLLAVRLIYLSGN